MLELPEILVFENKRHDFLKTISVWPKLNAEFFIGEPVEASNKKTFVASIKKFISTFTYTLICQPLHYINLSD